MLFRPCGCLFALEAHVVPLIGVSQFTISITTPVNRYSVISNSKWMQSAVASQLVGLMFPKCILMVADPIATATNPPQE
jgi:hypothetical protein